MKESSKDLMEKGWKEIEAHNFQEAEKHLTGAMEQFKKDNDWFNVTECLNHLTNLHKIKSVVEASKAVKLAEESYNIAKNHQTKDILILRSLVTAYMNERLYEKSISLAKKYIEQQDNIAAKGDMQTHLAECYFRSGKISEAKQVIERALENIDSGWEEEREPHRSIWKTKALKIKALILYGQDNIEVCRKALNEALEISKKQNLKTRILEVTRTINSLELDPQSP